MLILISDKFILNKYFGHFFNRGPWVCILMLPVAYIVHFPLEYPVLNKYIGN